MIAHNSRDRLLLRVLSGEGHCLKEYEVQYLVSRTRLPMAACMNAASTALGLRVLKLMIDAEVAKSHQLSTSRSERAKEAWKVRRAKAARP